MVRNGAAIANAASKPIAASRACLSRIEITLKHGGSRGSAFLGGPDESMANRPEGNRVTRPRASSGHRRGRSARAEHYSEGSGQRAEAC